MASLTKRQRDQVVRRLEKKERTADIADRFKISQRQVQYILAEMKPGRGRGRPKKEVAV